MHLEGGELLLGELQDTYQLIIHARDSFLVFAIWTIIVTITEQTIFNTPVTTVEIWRRTSESLESFVSVVTFCAVVILGTRKSVCGSG